MSLLKRIVDRRRSGFTLIELLVTIAIISLLSALALPKVKDALRTTALSRSATVVQGALMNARAIAMQDPAKRPCGVYFERTRRTVTSGGTTPETIDQLQLIGANHATRLSYVQIPARYLKGNLSVKAYPFASLLNQSNNCTATYHYFVKKEDAGLLYAAARGTQPAASLIRNGTLVNIAGRLSTISSLEVLTGIGASRLTDYVVEYVPGTNSCGDAPVSDPLVSDGLDVAGVVITTSDRFYSAPNVPGMGPDGLTAYTPIDPIEIYLEPTKAALAPVNLPGRGVVDLSMAGSRANPTAFGIQDIVGTASVDAATDNQLGGVIVMFGHDGKLESVYYETLVAVGGVNRFVMQRFDPPTSLSFLVGFSDGVLEYVDDGARYPDAIPGTTYPTNLTSRLGSPAPPAPLEPSFVPNFANTECAWVTVHSQSGAIDLTSVASQPPAGDLVSYFGFSASPSSTDVIRGRLDRARRFIYGGAL